MDVSADNSSADELAKVKALRKAKKKEIQAWTAAFEAREGRSPESSDKEAIRSMYRDFKDLDIKFAALSQSGGEQQQQSVGREDTGASIAFDVEDQTAAKKVGEATPMVQSSSAASGVGEGKSGDAPAVGVGENKAGGADAQLRALKNERDAKKQEIKLWIKEFEDREGRPPTSEDKAPIKDLYRKFKDIDKQLANSVTDGRFLAESREATEGGDAAGLEGGLYGGASVDPEEVKAEKKRVKREIQAWLDEFEAREGRPALAADKTAIRPLFKRNKDLERELARLTNQGSPGRSGASTSEPNSLVPQDIAEEREDAETTMVGIPTSPDDTKQEHGDAETTTVLNPTSPTVEGAIEIEHDQPLEQETGGDDTATEPAAAATAMTDGLSDQETTGTAWLAKSVDVEAKEENAEGGGVSDKRGDGGDNTNGVGVADGDGAATVNDDDEKKATQVTAGIEAVREGKGGGMTDERGSSRRSRRDDDLESGGLSPVPSVSPEISAIQNDADLDTAGHHVDPDDQQVVGTDGQNSDGDEEKQYDAEASGIGESTAAPNHGEGRDASSEGEEKEEGGVAVEDAVEVEPELDSAGVTIETRHFVPSGLVIDTAADTQPDERDKVPLTAQEVRVRRMRARFISMKSLLSEEDGGLASPTAAEPTSALWTTVNEAIFRDNEGEEGPEGDSSADKGAAAMWGGGRGRWRILGDAVAPNRKLLSPIVRSRFSPKATTANENGPHPLNSPSSSQGGYDYLNGERQGEKSSESAPLADDGVSAAWATDQMAKLLLSDAPPLPPPPPTGLDKLEAEAARLRSVVDPSPPEYLAEYQAGIRGAELVVASVGVDEVEARERTLELERLADAREETNVYRAREANLLFREDRARRRLTALEAAANKGVKLEKQAVIEISIARERALAPAFARARDGLEAAIRAQAGRVREVFGELRPGETVAGRRFRVDWKGVPQPVEIRLHCIRAVRDRLPRGSYVVLSSMAERLGGRSLRWGKGDGFDDFDDEDSMDTGGDVTRPSCTLPVRHGGRYFDRELRLDQNVYQVCPSKADVRPGNVMVFEVFRLAGSGGGGDGGGAQGSNRHKGGELDEDTAVGWCVLPLADSRLRVVRGSFRIPLLRGEPNPNIDLHEGLETLVAADLETWLGNLYLDVRHLPREARLDGVGVDGGTAIGGEGYDIEYDHVRKGVRLGKGLLGTLVTANGRWQRLRASKRDDDGENNVNGGAVGVPGGVPGLGDNNAAVKDETAGRPPAEDATDIETGRGAGSKAGAARDVDLKGKETLSVFAAVGEKGNVNETSTTAENDHKDVVSNKTEVTTTRDEATAGAKKKWRGAVAGSKETRGWGSLLSRKSKIELVIEPVTDGDEEQGNLGSGQADDPQPVGRDREETDGAADDAKIAGDNPDPSSLVEAPPPDGGWAEHLAPLGPAASGANGGGDGGVTADKTLDEECLSDDDMYRGRRFNFTPAGEAALAVETAAGAVTSERGFARGVGLRRRGEGARWDSAAMGTGRRGLPKRYGRGVGGGNAKGSRRDSHVWTRLTNPAEMEYYRFAVAADPGTDAPPTPAQVIRHKLRYIRQEVVLDLHPRGWRMMEYWLAVMVSLCALWLRVYLHALGQWFLLYAMGVPVFSFSPTLWEFAIKYMDRSSSLGVEVAFVSWGPTFVTLCFAIFAALARLWGMAACGGKGGGGGGGLPESLSRFVAAFGVAAILDPYLLFIVDGMAGNHDCSSQCSDYTAPSCRCHEGDAWKLYVRLEAEEGAGISGVLLTGMIYFMVSMVTALILHQYLLHAHMNGRMLDVWRRLNASEDTFFVPHDLEISAMELQHACVRSRRWRGPGGARREVVLHDFHVNEEAPGEPATVTPRDGGPQVATNHKGTMTTHVAIYDVAVEGKKSLHRQFLRTAEGTILELFGEAGREVGWQLRSSLNALMQQESGSSADAGGGKDQGIFAGMLPEAAPPAVPVDAPVVDGSRGVSDDRSGDTSRDIEAA